VDKVLDKVVINTDKSGISLQCFETQSSHAMVYRWMHFGSGGVRGFTFVGIIRALEQKDLLKHVKGVSGVSIGSFIATMLCYGRTHEQIFNLMEDMMMIMRDFNILGAASPGPALMRAFTTVNMVQYRERVRMCWLKHGLDPDHTFKTCPQERHLRIYAASYREHRLVRLDRDTAPDVAIMDALLASTSLSHRMQGIPIMGDLLCDAAVITPIVPQSFVDRDRMNRDTMCFGVFHTSCQHLVDGNMHADMGHAPVPGTPTEEDPGLINRLKGAFFMGYNAVAWRIVNEMIRYRQPIVKVFVDYEVLDVVSRENAKRMVTAGFMVGMAQI
jgi:predicted acylesterase/phospholipase RssA